MRVTFADIKVSETLLIVDTCTRCLSLLEFRFPQLFTYLQLKVADLSSVSISEYFDEALGFIDRYAGVYVGILVDLLES